MLARTWRCRILMGRSADYERFAREVSLPMFQGQPGFRGCLMTRDGDACEVVTLWDDQAAIHQMEASASYHRTLDAIRATGVLTEEFGTRVAEVHETSILSER